MGAILGAGGTQEDLIPLPKTQWFPSVLKENPETLTCLPVLHGSGHVHLSKTLSKNLHSLTHAAPGK